MLNFAPWHVKQKAVMEPPRAWYSPHSAGKNDYHFRTRRDAHRVTFLSGALVALYFSGLF